MNICVVCGKELNGKQTKLCSDRECHREWAKEYRHNYYQSNLEKIMKRRREQRQNNREQINKRSRVYYRDNQERITERHSKYRQNNQAKIKEYRQNNRESAKERSHKYYRNNRDEVLEKAKEDYQNNREKILERGHKHYRRARGLPEDCDLHKESSIEVIMKRWLIESDIEFVQQHSINFENSTWTCVDFFIPEANVCLYCDGDYWHSLSEVQERDARINKTLEGMKFSVVRMTEAEILEGNRPWWIGELISAKW